MNADQLMSSANEEMNQIEERPTRQVRTTTGLLYGLIMATNQYFNKFKNTPEQRLVQDLVDESIKIHGVNMVYIPRTLVNKDEIFGEDRLPKFENGRELRNVR